MRGGYSLGSTLPSKAGEREWCVTGVCVGFRRDGACRRAVAFLVLEP